MAHIRMKQIRSLNRVHVSDSTLEAWRVSVSLHEEGLSCPSFTHVSWAPGSEGPNRTRSATKGRRGLRPAIDHPYRVQPLIVYSTALNVFELLRRIKVHTI